MILETAVLSVRFGQEAAFERAFDEAKAIVASTPGFMSLELQRSLGTKGRYLLLVRWQTLEDHTVGFRGSPKYLEWKRRLHHFYDPAPSVEHYEIVADA